MELKKINNMEKEIIVVSSVIAIIFFLWLFSPKKLSGKKYDFVYAQDIYNTEVKGSLIEVIFEDGEVIYIDPKNYPKQFEGVVKELTCRECNGEGREEQFDCQKPGYSAGECCGGCYEIKECSFCKGEGFVNY
tara:strand:- start:65 stop:463 length:399 start_codon:yes stop_codon:yes gene_type:complete